MNNSLVNQGSLDQTIAVAKKLEKYERDLLAIFGKSIRLSHDLVEYIVNLLREDNHDHEVGAVLVKILQKRKFTRREIIKIIVKILYVVQSFSEMKYGDYFKLKKSIDENIKNDYVKKKYNLLLKKLCSNQIKRDVNKYYDKYDLEDESHLRQNISFI